MPYVVHRFEARNEREDVVRSFTARQVRGNPFVMRRLEYDHEVRARAQAFCDQLNAGGVARERALQEARQ